MGAVDFLCLCQDALNDPLMKQENVLFALRYMVSSGNIILLYYLTHAPVRAE